VIESELEKQSAENFIGEVVLYQGTSLLVPQNGKINLGL
jgi:hypothetical protein